MTAQRVADDDPTPESEPRVEATLLIRPRDPLVLRDARPFSADPGARAISLPWPLPRTVAGTMRTLIGNGAGLDWDKREDRSQARRETSSHGPLMVGQDEADGKWHAYVPAPRDVVFYREENDKTTSVDESKELHPMILRPDSLANGEGCDMPTRAANAAEQTRGFELAFEHTRLRPLEVSKDVKPEQDVPVWWRLTDVAEWLNTIAIAPPDSLFRVNSEGKTMLRGLGALPSDTRVHVSIDPGTQTNVEGALFTTESRAFRDAPVQESKSNPANPALAMLCKVETSLPWRPMPALVPLGGERRISSIAESKDAQWPEVVYPKLADFEEADGLRLFLVTPALFRYGWLPAWMADGTICGLKGEKSGVALVGAAIERRIPVSGWRMGERGHSGKQPEAGPRRTQYAVPAGGVYFFKFNDGLERSQTKLETIWKKLWLKPVSDHGVDRDEGFGLVLPGLWRENDQIGGDVVIPTKEES